MEFQDKVAVITGAASGIGLALAQEAARRGMDVALADVEAPALAAAEAKLQALGAKTLAVPTDVSSAESVEALARRVYAELGPVGLLCNNAGVNVPVTRRIWQYSPGDWQWVMGVNLWGVIHGVQAFVPRMLEQSSPSHILNTCSSAGLLSSPGLAVYKVTKHGVLSLSESLYHDLSTAGANIGVSVLLPDVVKTGLRDSARNRPPELLDERPKSPEEQAAEDTLRAAPGMQPPEVAQIAFDGIGAGRLYLFTSDGSLDMARQRLADMQAGVPEPVAALREDLLAPGDA